MSRHSWLIGEIERALRRILSRRFEKEELKGAIDPDSSRAVESANDLTLGETGRFIAKAENWQRLHWPVQRAVFVEAFEEIRDIRTT